MKHSFKTYLKLFTSTFYLSAFTFGGGYVIVPLMRKKFVNDLKWVEEKEMLDFTAISQSSPGPIAVNASILIGYKIAGIPGALVTVLGTILPPLIIISIISLFYAAFKANPVINAILKGMQAGVAAVIADVVISMGTSVLKENKLFSAIVMAVAFIAVYFLEINVALIILAAGLVGILSAVIKKRTKEQGK